MADLQHVNRSERAASDERGLHRRLCVAGQQRAEAAVADDQHDGAVVDVVFRQRCRRVGR